MGLLHVILELLNKKSVTHVNFREHFPELKKARNSCLTDKKELKEVVSRGDVKNVFHWLSPYDVVKRVDPWFPHFICT